MSKRSQPVAHRSTLDQIGQVVAYGNSTIAGNAVSDPSRDLMTRLAGMFGAKEFNYAKGGAVLMWSNDIARSEYGVIGTVLQTWKRTPRAAAKLTGSTLVGDTTIGVTPNPSTGSTTGPAFKAEDVVMIGNGTNGEIARIASVTSTTVTMFHFEGVENYSGLVRTHSANDPIYVVPTHYAPGNTIFIVGETGSQVGVYGPGVYADAQRWYQEALRMIVSRLRTAESYDPDHTALVFTGSWGAATLSTAASGSTAAQGIRTTGAVNDSVTFHTPDNFRGGTISFNLLQNAGTAGGAVWTFTVDGAGAGTLTTVATPTTPVNKNAYYCKRLTGLAAGRHTIVAQITTYVAGTSFDCFNIEAEDPPVVVLMKGHRFLTWDASNAIEHGHIRPLLNAQANPGATAVVVNQSPYSGSRLIAASPQVPKAGEFIVINPRTSLEEVRTVTTVTGAGAPFTINFSGGGLANTHPVGTRVEVGCKDYDQRVVINPWIESVQAEFDDFVVLHDPEPYIWPRTSGTYSLSGGPKDNSLGLFHEDETHFSDRGQALVTEMIYRQLVEERHVDPRMSSRLTRPVSIPSSRIDFLNGSTVAWINIPAALSEFPLTTATNGFYRRQADLSRAYECRIGCVQTVIGTSGCKLRVQYSIDGGTTFRHLNRVSGSSTDIQATSTSWVEATAATDFMWAEIDIGVALPSSGVRYSSWSPIYPEAFTDVLLRIVGIGGNAALDPAFNAIWLEWR